MSNITPVFQGTCWFYCTIEFYFSGDCSLQFRRP